METKYLIFTETYSLQKQIIDDLIYLLDDEFQKEVIRLFEHDEYEMSFEGLFLELINNGIYPNPFDFDKYKSLGKILNLNSESVFDSLFWKKFLKWGEVEHKDFKKNKL